MTLGSPPRAVSVLCRSALARMVILEVAQRGAEPHGCAWTQRKDVAGMERP